MPYKEEDRGEEGTRIPRLKASGQHDLDPNEGRCYEGIQNMLIDLQEKMATADKIERKSIMRHYAFLTSFAVELKTITDLVENAKFQVSQVPREDKS